MHVTNVGDRNPTNWYDLPVPDWIHEKASKNMVEDDQFVNHPNQQYLTPDQAAEACPRIRPVSEIGKVGRVNGRLLHPC